MGYGWRHHAQVCVIIAAKDAAATIQRAVRSALREEQVAEIVVVDDGSTDATAKAARAADDGTGRLRVLTLGRQQGPRLRQKSCHCPFGRAADRHPRCGRFFPERPVQQARRQGRLGFRGRQHRLHRCSGARSWPNRLVPDFEAEPCFLDLPGFIEGNISRRGAARGEIGFLKPVMRRAFLDAHGLRYNEDLRLGEDYDLYARALAKGARYKVVHGCGYAAVVRSDSLSGRHKTRDLQRLYEADRAMLASPAIERGGGQGACGVMSATCAAAMNCAASWTPNPRPACGGQGSLRWLGRRLCRRSSAAWQPTSSTCVKARASPAGGRPAAPRYLLSSRGGRTEMIAAH